MAIAYVNKGTFTYDFSDKITVPLPSGWAVGDLLLLICASINAPISVDTSGWQEVYDQTNTQIGTKNTHGAIRLAVFYKFATSGETNVSVTALNNLNVGICTAWRGINTTTPFEISSANVNSGTSITFPTITTAYSGEMVINLIGLDRDGISTTNLSNWANSDLNSITEGHDQTVSTTYGGGLGFAYGVKNTAGAVKSTTVTQAVAGIYVNTTIALIPEATATTPIISTISYTKTRISGITGMTTSTVIFKSDVDLLQWEARAGGSGVGQGLLVGSGTTITANTNTSFDVDYTELTQGDQTYRINIYGRNATGWSTYG